MIINENYTFQVSLSKDIYSSKEQTIAAVATNDHNGPQLRKECGLKNKLCFKEQTLTTSQLLDKALQGHTFCTLFGNFTPPPKNTTYLRKDGCFTMSGKCNHFFQGSYFIGVDIDDTKYNPQDFISHLTLKPSMWYTSLSHLLCDKNSDGKPDNRFRLIYVFDSKIQDSYYFRYCASNLYKIIESDTGEEIKDKCGMVSSQYFNGTYSNSDVLNVDYGLTNYIYSLDDINVSDNGYCEFLSHGCEYKGLNANQKDDIKQRLLKLFSQSDININEQNKQHIISEWEKTLRICSDTPIEIDSQLVNDYTRLSYEEFFRHYKNKYSLIYRTEREDWEVLEKDGNYIKYQVCNENYIELPWIGRTDKDGTVIRRKDGQHRRDTLYIRGWLRRIIKPNMTPNELFFNLAYDIVNFFDNSDNVLNADFIQTKVQQCFSFDVNYYKEEYHDTYNDAKEKCKGKKFIIHWASKKLINPKELSKEIRWALFDQIYDLNLTPMENLQIFIDSDIAELDRGLSKSAIYRYCDDRGIDTNISKQRKIAMFRKLHIDGMSLPKERKYLQEHGLKMSEPTIKVYRELIALDRVAKCMTKEKVA